MVGWGGTGPNPMVLGGLRHNISTQMGARDQGRLQNMAAEEGAEGTWMHRGECVVVLHCTEAGGVQYG